MHLTVFLLGILASWPDGIWAEYLLPLDDCRDGDIDLLLVSDPWSDSALQIRRFKNVVQWFFPASSNDPMRLRLHLLVHVNETHSESLIHFKDYNTTEGLMEGLDRIFANQTFITKLNKYYSRKCLENAEQIFETSKRIHAKRLAIVFTFVNHWRCTQIRKSLVRYPIEYSFYTYFIRDTSSYTYDDRDQNVRVISGTEDLMNDQKIGSSLCGQCLNGWLTLRTNGSRSKLSCFFIKEFDKGVSRKKASSFCDLLKTKLASIETKKELNFLQTHIEGINQKHSDYFVHIGLAQRKYNNVYGFLWDNNLPLTFDFPMAVTNDRTPSSIKHLAWISRIRSRDGKVTCDSVADVQETQLVICELQDILPTTKIVAEIQKTRDEHFFKLKNHSEFIYHTDLSSSFLLSTSNHRIYNAETHLMLFVCDDYNSVPYTLVCDGYKDCYNGRDEEVCAKFSPTSRLFAHNQQCKTKIEFSPEHFFSDEQRCDGHPDCPEGDDEAGCDDVCLETLCDDGTCLPSQWFTNSSRACRFILPVNGVTDASLNLTHSNNCSEFCDDGPCVYPRELAQGIVFCDDKYMDVNSCNNVLENKTWAARCILLKGRFNTKLGCSDLSHLDNCDTFNCPEGLFKCPSSYCIPVYNLNDGYPDCPFGEDEEVQIVSENLFQCIAMDDSKSIYILPVHVCDNKRHCPRGDDELGCHVTCPAGFQCLAGTVNPAIHPDKITLTSLSELHTHTKFLNLSGIDLSRVSTTSPGNLNELLELHASNCNLSSAENIFFNDEIDVHVYLIDLSFNNIREINDDSLFGLTKNLKILNLSHNLALHNLDIDISALRINSLDVSFTNLMTFNFQNNWFQFLNLSFTRIRYFDFSGDSIKLGIFDLRSTGLMIDQETANAFARLSVTSAMFGDSFKMCCPQIRGPGIPGDFCFAPQDAFSSCEDLLGDQVKRILLWILAVVSTIGNLTVIGFRLVLERKLITKSYRLLITNLSISDLIMGVYLFIIAGNDVYYREDYIMYDSEWRHSHMCTAAGFLATLSCETSALFVLLITLERYLVIRFPLGPYRIKRVKKYFLLLVSWLGGVILAVVPLVYPDWGVYSSNGMCLGLPMTRNQESGWAYSFGVFLIFNCVLFILIAVGQLAIFQVMSLEKTQLHTGALSLAKRRREIMVAKNLSLVVMSNFLCWFPICVIGLMTARGHTFSQQTYGWLAVFVLPLNSAVNPVIYTLPVVYKKWEDFKNGKTKNNSCTEVTTT